jgi:hypothetical protein
LHQFKQFASGNVKNKALSNPNFIFAQVKLWTESGVPALEAAGYEDMLLRNWRQIQLGF